jgi:hypothetical protein
MSGAGLLIMQAGVECKIISGVLGRGPHRVGLCNLHARARDSLTETTLGIEALVVTA